jgi:hypothetical protein
MDEIPDSMKSIIIKTLNKTKGIIEIYLKKSFKNKKSLAWMIG